MSIWDQNELDFPSEYWAPFAAHLAVVRCSSGYLIYLQNTCATCFYYLKRGRVKSFIQSEDGEERLLRIYEPGYVFGEASFFDELPRVSSAMALTDCELVAIDREVVEREFAKSPVLAMAMIRYLAQTVRMLSGQVDDMSFRPAPQRIAKHLLALAALNRHISITQEEIAAAVSASRVTVSRTLSRFAKNKWATIGYGTITIERPEALIAFCELE